MGGGLERFYFAFGDCDVIAVAELPDNVTATALAISSTPGLSSYKTMPLLTMDEAMRKASGTGYRSPQARRVRQ